jgi:hypothetical protein
LLDDQVEDQENLFAESKKSIDQLEWGIPYNTDNFVEPLSEEGVNISA